jgi:hypothetical protein
MHRRRGLWIGLRVSCVAAVLALPLALTLEGQSSTSHPRSTVPLTFDARFTQRTYAARERVPLLLGISYSGKDVITVDDPRLGGDCLRFTVQMDSAPARHFTVGEALEAPGVRRMQSGMKVVGGSKRVVTLDLATLTDLRTPGRYTVTVEYTWKAGEQPWRSRPLQFLVRQAAATKP